MRGWATRRPGIAPRLASIAIAVLRTWWARRACARIGGRVACRRTGGQRRLALLRWRTARLLHRAPLGSDRLSACDLFGRGVAMFLGNLTGRRAVEIEALRTRRRQRLQVGIGCRVA